MVAQFPLSAGWAAHQDAAGQIFYANATTGEASWSVVGVLLPDGWAAYSDVEGRFFYCNQELGLTQWRHPTPLPVGWVVHLPFLGLAMVGNTPKI